MVRKVLRNLQKAGFVECLGRGPRRSGGKEVIPFKKGNKEGINCIFCGEWGRCKVLRFRFYVPYSDGEDGWLTRT